jgi:RNA polymerase sigma-70 factor (ECF subfamily)
MVLRAREGDMDAMAELVTAHRGLVYAYALRMLRNADDAHDVTQETFVKALHGLRGFDAGRALVPWLLKICRNCCIDHVRARRRNAEPSEILDTFAWADGSDVHDEVEGEIRSQELNQAIARLPERYREIMLMRHVEDLEINEIADRLRRPEGTVKSWLFRARALLREDRSLAAV